MYPNPASIARLRLAATAAALTAAAAGAAAMLGWIADAGALKHALDMKANGALGLILAGLALAVTTCLRERALLLAAARAAALLAFGLAAVVLCQFMFGIQLGVDQLLFDDPGAAHPGRMALNTSICLMLVSLGVLAAQKRERAPLPPVIGLAVIGAGSLTLIGHFAGVNTLDGVVGATQMAIPTAASVVLLGLALVCSQPESSFMRLLSSSGTGGVMVRRVLPLAVVGVIGLATLRAIGQDIGVWGPEVGTWLFASSCIVLIVWVVWRAGWFLEGVDSHRRELAEQLRELAERDPLTHLFNRRRFDEALAHQVAVSRRYGAAFSVLILDLDHFKYVNDTRGHQAGDRLLKETARTLDGCLRGSDVVARLGGDEFVVLLPHTDLEGCDSVARKLLLLLRARQIKTSIGGVVCEPPIATSLRPGAVLGGADRALYEVKTSGRGRAVIRRLEEIGARYPHWAARTPPSG